MCEHSEFVSFSGKEVVVADSPIGRLGVTVCYDLRFPALYQLLRFQHEAQVHTRGSLSFEYDQVSFLPRVKSNYAGSIGACGVHKSDWSSTLGNSSSCSCN